MFKEMDIRAISLVSSCGCNLHCKYCLIENTLNNCSANLQHETIKALNDGTFLNNVKGIFKRLSLDRYKIECFTLWGQEPTLTLHLLTDHLEDWFNYFPNINHIDYSTNGMDFPERTVNFIKKVDELANNELALEVQFSYDGTYSTNNIRNANNEKIFETASTVIKELNKIKFHNVNVSIQLHGVLSGALIHELNTTQKVHDYYKDLDNFGFELADINLNQRVEVNSSVSICPENPRDGSVDERIEYESFLQRIVNIDVSDFHDPHLPVSIIIGYRHLYEEVFSDLHGFTGEDRPITPQELMRLVMEGNQEAITVASRNNFCSGNFNELKLLYDGTMMSCQNFMFDLDGNNVKDDGTIGAQLRKDTRRTKTDCINLLTDSEEDINKVIYKYNMYKTHSFPFMFQATVNTLQMLNECNQLNSIYKYNPDKLLRLALIATKIDACTYNNFISSGSALLRSVGTLRTQSALFMYVDRENNLLKPEEEWFRNTENMNEYRGESN